jgi:hypothetical protein
MEDGQMSYLCPGGIKLGYKIESSKMWCSPELQPYVIICISELLPPRRCLYITFMDFFLNMINLGMNVVKVTAFKRFDFVNVVVPIIIALIESCC